MNQNNEMCKCPKNEPCEFHDSMSIDELKMRKGMVESAIKMVAGEGDPHEVIPEYRRQASVIDAAIRKRIDKTHKPPPTTVGLNTAKLTGKALSAKGGKQ